MQDATALSAPVPAASPAPAPVVLQSLLWPEAGFSSERDLYLRLEGPAFWTDDTNEVSFGPAGELRFDTAFNLFNLGKWRRSCALDQIGLRLHGAGRFELAVFQALPGRSWERLVNRIVTLEPGLPLDLALAPVEDPLGSVLWFTLKALDAGRFSGADWITPQQPLRQPDLVITVTTFRREAAVRASVARFEDFMRETPLAPHLHMVVVDNGQSAEIPASAHVTPVPNENLGGAGGFARGLLEAEARGASHCLFMDDDASVHMAALERTWMFLAYATDPATAVAAGLLSARHRWAMWENGALFDRVCRPQFMGTDLRDIFQTVEMEMESTPRNAPNFYGGWWFFAFPLASAQYRPFPFFVRGDDVSFSLANTFDIVTLPGVVSSQEADFSDKESPLTVYLDLRSHLVHHLSLPSMEIGRRGLVKLLAFFFLRSLIQMHYETIAAQSLAVQDVMRGPDFFAANADMAQRRADLAALRKVEAWHAPEGPLPAPRKRLNPENPLVRLAMKATLNGHLLPFFGLFGNRLVLKTGERGAIRRVWGAAAVTCRNDAGQIYTVRHSKLAALRATGVFLRDLLRLMLRYPALRAEWRQGYERLASTGFWRGRLGLDAPAETGAPRP